ncbi:eukaryotic translation initiation factor 5B-like [Styela clava]
MGKKKGKKTGVAEEEKSNLDTLSNEEKLETNGTNEEVSTKKGGKANKKKKEDNWEDDIANEIAELSIENQGGKVEKKDENQQQEAGNEEPEFFDPGDDERSKKKKNKKKQKEVVEESTAPTPEVTENNEPEFYDPSDDEKSKKKKKKKQKQQVDETPEPAVKAANDNEPEFFEPSDDDKKQKKKKEKVDDLDETGENEETSTVKTKAQKQAEKKERERKKKERQKAEKAKQESKNQEQSELEKTDAATEGEKEEKSASKKKDKKGKKAKGDEKDDKTRKKPNKAMIKAMQENLNRIKLEEERLKLEEEEKRRIAEEAERERLKKIEEERLRKERKKQKDKDRIKRLKAEGKYLTPAQKEAQRRNEIYLESLRAQGLLPNRDATAKKPQYGRMKKQKKDRQTPSPEHDKEEEVIQEEVKVDEKVEEVKQEEEVKEEDDVIDDWEAITDEENENEAAVKDSKGVETKDEDEGESSEEEEESSEEEESPESESESEDDDLSPRERAERRIQLRKEQNEKNRSLDDLRSPVICVMGHVDTGKTKILDKIRHSHVQDGEAGGITQQIGATFVPLETIKEQTSMVKSFQESEVKLPGLLVIDTPGHESFSNLRSRGSSVCDMAILVVDIMHGLEPQTIESITMLKKRKTPFVVALNKVDRLYEWKPGPTSDIVNTLKKQKRHVKEEFDERLKEVIVDFAKQNLNVKLFHENDDPKEWISMVPTSAHSGDGMGNLIALVMQLCQTMLPKRLAFSEELQCTVLEVKAIQGLGTTIDVILTNGRLKYGDTIVIAGVEGPIVTHLKGLLMPQPLKELRVKNPYDKYDDLKAAQGIKILAKDLEKALAGTQLLVAHKEDEIDILKSEVQAEVDKTLQSIKLQERGVFVQASTLGSLEALLSFLKQSKIPYAGINIGPVHKKDIMKASVMLEHDSQWATILAFDVKVEREAQDMADNLGVKIFTADIIYNLFDAFMKHREDLKKQKQEEFRHVAVFPCKVRILPNCVFKSRDPIVVGVVIDAGQLRQNTPLCIPTREFLTVGYVTSMEFNHKSVDIARVGQEVCIKIEGTPGEPPKMVGRHFEETDILVSKISRDSINALKDWFREEMQKPDWQLTIELKKLFEII